MGVQEAGHEQTSPEGATLIISRLERVLSGQTRKIRLISGTKSARAYGKSETKEQFRCNFGLNPNFRDDILKEPLQIAGVDENEEVRIVEISNHPFFIATLFLPQLSSCPSEPHPLITAYLQAATEFHHMRSRN